MRIVKEAEERRNEILDAADELFGRKGFDGTSTNDILEKVGIARGTLYYHFKSKEDILDALIQRYEEQMYSAAAAAAKDGSLPVTVRSASGHLSSIWNGCLAQKTAGLLPACCGCLTGTRFPLRIPMNKKER